MSIPESWILSTKSNILVFCQISVWKCNIYCVKCVPVSSSFILSFICLMWVCFPSLSFSSYPTLQLCTRITSQPPSNLNSPQQKINAFTFGGQSLAKLLSERGIHAMVPSAINSSMKVWSFSFHTIKEKYISCWKLYAIIVDESLVENYGYVTSMIKKINKMLLRTYLGR